MQTNRQPTASMEQLRQRAMLITAIRQFFAERQVMEVDTPAMSHATVTDIHLHTFQTEFVEIRLCRWQQTVLYDQS